MRPLLFVRTQAYQIRLINKKTAGNPAAVAHDAF
ncbi:hypothetical protein SPAB_02425 [Salmonella enterica subsp. enterica serovar Paratyphi B str. SPB7]|uniref:Uncharacterized protein n=1 Tax=Salmonella paratyphi B (strain ATCC BAA-1250 / SPB7) TaxID=1016998 RepID=A0A6C6Z3C1_SALPB|nr:hypothetical protein SPAB_02425 [Salmonella enterica subsp. enterica serovar Paratyphi B str. SPB7]